MASGLSGKVIVVTGASSGIGRATALRFARAGASVALASRSRDALAALAGEIERAGGRALAVDCDVADDDAVERLAVRAEEALGPIDAWVNDAGVYALGRFEDTPPEVFRKLVDTNLLGTVNGSRAALKRFRARGRGVLVNVASIDGRIAAPYASAYSATKHAVVGFSAALRQELRLEGKRHVHVSVVLPATIDTPLFHHAANFTGVEVKALPPVYPPDKVARTIARLVVRPRREALVGTAAHVMSLSWTLAPSLAERAIARMVHRSHFRRHRAAADSPGNAFAPSLPEAATGGWLRPHRWARRAALALPAVAAVAAGARWARGRAG
jgi:short-subunit dehydrogenase